MTMTKSIYQRKTLRTGASTDFENRAAEQTFIMLIY